MIIYLLECAMIPPQITAALREYKKCDRKPCLPFYDALRRPSPSNSLRSASNPSRRL